MAHSFAKDLLALCHTWTGDCRDCQYKSAGAGLEVVELVFRRWEDTSGSMVLQSSVSNLETLVILGWCLFVKTFVPEEWHQPRGQWRAGYGQRIAGFCCASESAGLAGLAGEPGPIQCPGWLMRVM